MSHPARATTRRGAVEVGVPVIGLLVVLSILGVVTRWSLPVVTLTGAVGVGLLIYVLTAARAGFAIGGRWLQCGQAVVVIALAASSVILAVTSYQRWVSRPDQHRRDVVQVAAEASTAAGLLTTITNANRDEYLKRLRPHVTDEVLQALKGSTVGVPTGTFTQTSIVKSVSVEIVEDGAATAIAVVQPTPPPPANGLDADPDGIILLLILARYEDHWVVVNLAPLGVRPAYASTR